ncbi:ArsR/SmtB family transcription factor [Sinomonas terrae]|jgi:DNA-binding transcriptional ArsR family regulator|uniref:Metalloregulator ArsR/SmtB family transcription factor n=1 Tax=Sinomonas terrae TaxID=2908838 RepID=A0ABS9TXD9_9MICC|nr:metalloregulator ArsR/SmtB family transcription factor [Sinomonas terrae]MCH6469078.1 metalloregulator ArsR/SmtB family transcription factor [Sinomonas terrae]
MMTDIFAVIADHTRRAILRELRAGDKAVGELVEALDASQPTVSKHLKVLRDAGLVTTRAQGQKRYYALRLEPLAEVGGWLTSLRTTAAPAPEEAPAPSAGVAVVPSAPALPAPAVANASIEPLAPSPAGVAAASGTRPQQIQRTVERTVERAAKGAAEIIANLPKWRRKEPGRQQG